MSDAWMNGVYPKMVDGLFGTRKGHLETRLKEASESYAKIFPELREPDRLAEYLEKRDPKIRELFLETGQFVGIMYDRLSSIPEYLRDSVTILMMFSIIETLQAGMKKYVKLVDWFQGQECARKLDELTEQGLDSKQKLKALAEMYASKYGSTFAAMDFFDNCLAESDKKSMIRSYGTLKECLMDAYSGRLRTLLPDFQRMTVGAIKNALGNQIETETRYLPVCYGPTCYVHYNTCEPSVECRLDEDENLLRLSLQKIVKRLLYAYRNAFVHKSSLPMIPVDTKSTTTRNTRMVFDRLDGRHIVHELDLDFLLKAFGTSLRKFFDAAAVA